MSLDSSNSNNKYFCLNCKDKNYLIQCTCGTCNEVIFKRSKYNVERKYIKGHERRGKYLDLSANWKGGRRKDRDGYVLLYMPDYFSSNKSGYVSEHVYFYQEYHQCCVLKWSSIHHIIPISRDYCNNMPWNLMGMTTSQHRRLELTGKKYRSINMDGRRCSDPECLHPERTGKNRIGRPNWHSDGNGNLLCNICYLRRYRRKKLLMCF